jgi:hypothetical protein
MKGCHSGKGRSIPSSFCPYGKVGTRCKTVITNSSILVPNRKSQKLERISNHSDVAVKEPLASSLKPPFEKNRREIIPEYR